MDEKYFDWVFKAGCVVVIVSVFAYAYLSQADSQTCFEKKNVRVLYDALSADNLEWFEGYGITWVNCDDESNKAGCEDVKTQLNALAYPIWIKADFLGGTANRRVIVTQGMARDMGLSSALFWCDSIRTSGS